MQGGPCDNLPFDDQKVYKPSKFNFMMTVDNGLLLYNSLSGAMGIVPAEFSSEAKRALRQECVSSTGLSEQIVQSLVDGGFLVDVQTNEEEVDFKKYITKYESDRLNLIILPTEDCNFRCTYCYEKFTRGIMPREVINGIKRYISKQKAQKQIHVSWFGGEPLLAKEVIFEVQEHAMEHAKSHGIDFSSSITTNGSLLYPDVAEKLISLGVRNYQITIDGIKDVHDKRRVAIDGGTSFDRIMDNLKHLHTTQLEYSVMLRTNIDRDNASNIDAIIRYYKQAFADDHRFHVYFQAVGRWGGPNDASIRVLSAYEAARINIEATKLASQAGLSNRYLLDSLRPSGFSCYAADPTSFVIGANGAIYKCTVELDSNDRNIVGQLLPSGEMKLDIGKIALWVEANGREPGHKCWSCVHRPSCHGASCPKEWLDGKEAPCPPALLTARSTLNVVLNEAFGNNAGACDGPPHCTV